MKKIISLLLIALMALSVFAACGKKEQPVKTGLAVISSTASSKAVEDGKGTAQVDSTVVAVILDTDGKIANCVIDSVQSKIQFDDVGQIITDLDTVFETKNERKEDYGMKNNSSIQKEWYEQADALAAYVKGKTLSEVKGIKVDDKGYPTGSDLTSSVTMNISGYISAIEKAVNNAKALGASATDKLGLGIVTNIAGSTAATASADGKAQAYSTYAAITVDANGKITSCILDASQTNVTFNTSGAFTGDLNAAHKTKNELGAAYNMKSKSEIGKEWNEQAEAFAKYVTGKTLTEVEGIAINEDKKPTGDLSSSVTISVDGFIDALKKAHTTAK